MSAMVSAWKAITMCLLLNSRTVTYFGKWLVLETLLRLRDARLALVFHFVVLVVVLFPQIIALGSAERR